MTTRAFELTPQQAHELASCYGFAQSEGVAVEHAGLAAIVDDMLEWAEANGGSPPPPPPRNRLADVLTVDLEANRHWTGPGYLEQTGYIDPRDDTQGVITDEIDLEQEGRRP